MKINNKEYGFTEKWSPEIEVYNFTQVPNLLLACQGHLKLSDGELITLIHLLMFWFSHDSSVYPSINKLCKFSESGYSTVQRRLKNLEEKKFIKRRRKLGTSNTYDLIPCVIKLYKHQKICTDLPRKKGDYKLKKSNAPTPLVTNKEYEFLTRLNSNNTKNNVGKVLESEYGGFTW